MIWVLSRAMITSVTCVNTYRNSPQAETHGQIILLTQELHFHCMHFFEIVLTQLQLTVYRYDIKNLDFLSWAIL